ncbi:hypothetical protein MOD31_08140 [Paenarthrobacter sp. TYUT067]|uniref:hypothetical protein n=1 Tax=Paenarthrobacter sp. TYUT067 TaxID=2926245 RepID=UPI00202F16A1|nr:hypothetical protein [Paenarthrobacter sp. TYUT067]MCM0615991.1 hypothetical protein [Paenarthrobacter sp. TYUT067]
MPQGEPIWIYSAGDPADIFEHLAQELRSRGVVVTGPTTNIPTRTSGVVVVAISRHSGDSKIKVDALRPFQGRILPVVEGLDASPVFSDLSQLYLGELGVEHVADHIMLVWSIGGGSLAALTLLEDKARQWSVADKAPSHLLRGAAVDEAIRVLSKASSVATRNVNLYVRAGVDRRQRRNRLLAWISGVVAAALTAASGIALIQQHEADASRLLANNRTAGAESVRLAGLATSLIGTDPDLPWLLAEEALHQSNTAEAIAAARRVVQSAPTHLSVRLQALPRFLSTDRESGTIAVQYVDGITEIRRGDDGRLIRSIPSNPMDSPGVALAPGGKLLALGTRLVDSGTGNTIDEVDGSFCGWTNDSRAVFLKNGRLGIRDIPAGVVTQTQVSINNPEQLIFSTAAHVPVATVLDGNQLLSVDLTTGTAMATKTIDVTGGRDLATSDDGTLVYVALSDGAKGFKRTDAGLTSVDVRGSGSMVVSTGTTWAIGDNVRPTTQIGISSGTILSSYVSHRGPVVGIGALPNGRTATIGADGYLRLWESPPSIAYPNGSDQLRSDLFSRAAPSKRAMDRPQAVLSTDGTAIVASNASNGTAAILDSSDFRKIAGMFVGNSPSATIPLPGKVTLHYVPDHVFTVIDVQKLQVLWRTKVSDSFDPLVAAANDKGTRVGFATSTEMVTIGADGSFHTTSFNSTATPVWIGVTDDSTATVLSDGRIFRDDAPSISLAELGSPVAAAGAAPGGSIFAIGTNGTLAEESDGELRKILQLDAGLGAFALRVSNDGSQVAVIGLSGGAVVNPVDGHVLLDLTPQEARFAVIRDLVIDGGTVWLLRADGGFQKLNLSTEDQLLQTLERDSPRELSGEEAVSLKNTVITTGAG